ncbi:Arf/Sar family, other [Angomonas deanei]|uniref:Ras of Complex, Roc, domain of DAPkinase/ADP-ribosylation factor family, putative n=1 Tax=Angomonas deanei TaxID=59799 RepID=A0A7G2CN81_9TRYP|nr:Arf/Sar family, other [Angomonas deanei]CAD2221296.1 Ras of Complex, Roc, domain of DAPkinase/ADP-ribosylation factor family, putative [Angomonas deanei]|eukprot:EPY29021.1 Arf/Sar family, other [Angomonas deanei]
MLHFFQSVYDSIFAEESYSILILGHENSGKTVLLEQLKHMYHHSNNNNTNTNPNRSITPLTKAEMSKKKIYPTVGMNYTKITHYFSPLRETVPFHQSDSPPKTTEAENANQSNEMISEMEKLLFSYKTNLSLWDLGGQRDLRTLWKHYYYQCHGILFVVDSRLLHSNNSNSNTNWKEDSALYKEELKRVYAPVRQTIFDLLLEEKCLERVKKEEEDRIQNSGNVKDDTTTRYSIPFLILNNKVDDEDEFGRSAPSNNNNNTAGTNPRHSSVSVEDLMEALDLYTLAAEVVFYATKETNPSDAARVIPYRAPTFSSSGFGHIQFKIINVSAATGKGVAAAMDWLVMQMKENAKL